MIKINSKIFLSELILSAGLGHKNQYEEQEPRGMKKYVIALNKKAVSDRCEAKTLDRERFFISFLSLKKEKDKSININHFRTYCSKSTDLEFNK